MALFDRLRTLTQRSGRPLRPIDVGRAMLAAVDAQVVTTAAGRQQLANQITVRLASSDASVTCPDQAQLINELIDALRAHSTWRGIALAGDPSVTITLDDTAPSGSIEVAARLAGTSPQPPSGTDLPPPVISHSAPAAEPTAAPSDHPPTTIPAVAGYAPVDEAVSDNARDESPVDAPDDADSSDEQIDSADESLSATPDAAPDDAAMNAPPLDAAAQLAALVAEEPALDDVDEQNDEPLPDIATSDDVRALLDTAPIDIVRALGALVADDARYPIGTAPIRIGRMSDNTVVVHHAHVSRYHAEVRNDGGRAVLVDLGSTNGTRHNGVRVDGHVALSHGDEITLGDVVLRFESA